MARTHPPTLVTLARAALRQDGLAPRGMRIVVAVSGGPDSMALVHVLALLRSRFGFGLFAHGVDHGLRRESAAELDSCGDLRAVAGRALLPHLPRGGRRRQLASARSHGTLGRPASRRRPRRRRPNRHRSPCRRPRRNHAHPGAAWHGSPRPRGASSTRRRPHPAVSPCPAHRHRRPCVPSRPSLCHRPLEPRPAFPANAGAP